MPDPYRSEEEIRNTEPRPEDETPVTDYLTEVDDVNVPLEEVVGLDDTVEKVQCTIVEPHLRENAAIRPQTVLFNGPEGVAPEHIIRATGETLARKGFDFLTLKISDIGGREYATILEGFESGLDEWGPSVIWIPAQALQQLDSYRGQQAFEAFSQTNGRQLLLCESPSGENRHRRKSQLNKLGDVMEVTVTLSNPDEKRRPVLFKRALENVSTEYGLKYDVDENQLQEVGSQAANFTYADCTEATERAAIIATGADAETPTITAADLSLAVDQLMAEGSSGDTPGQQRKSTWYKQTTPDTTFDDIGGLDDVITRVRDYLVIPNQYADIYDGTPLAPANGVLLYGPPGTGKTMLAGALANETDRTFYRLDGPSVKNKWFGESEERIRNLFQEARSESPSLIYFDEIDALAPRRNEASHSAVQSIVATLLAELDGMEERGDVLVLASSNRPEAIDPAVLRPGRIGESIEVPKPDTTGCQEIFSIYTDGLPIAADVTPTWFAKSTPEPLSGAQINGVVEASLKLAIRATRDADRDGVVITRADVQTAFEQLCKNGDERERGAFV